MIPADDTGRYCRLDFATKPIIDANPRRSNYEIRMQEAPAGAREEGKAGALAALVSSFPRSVRLTSCRAQGLVERVNGQPQG